MREMTADAAQDAIESFERRYQMTFDKPVPWSELSAAVAKELTSRHTRMMSDLLIDETVVTLTHFRHIIDKRITSQNEKPIAEQSTTQANQKRDKQKR